MDLSNSLADAFAKPRRNNRRARYSGRPARSLIGAAIAFALAVAMIVPTAFSNHKASAAPPPASSASLLRATPPAPADPTLLWQEDFEQGQTDQWMLLSDYENPPGTKPYTADPYWLTDCNGVIASKYTDRSNGSSWNCTDWEGPYNLAQLASAMDALNGTDGTHILSAYTQSQTPTGTRLMELKNPITLNPKNRFIVFSLDAAESACNIAGAEQSDLTFGLLSGSSETSANISPITPCTGSYLYHGLMWGDIYGGKFYSDKGIYLPGDSLRFRLNDLATNNNGDDLAVDNISLWDATPTLSKAFNPDVQIVGENSDMVLTITNTTDLAEKAGWSFVDTLAPGLEAAPTSQWTSTCRNPNFAASGSALTIGGDLAADMASCQVHIPVTSHTAGTYVNGAANISDEQGMNPPAEDASVKFVDPDYTIAKTSSPASGSNVGANEPITYQVVVTNSTPVAFTRTITDDLSDVLDDGDLTGSPTASSGPAPSVDGTTLSWTGTLPANGSVTLSYTITTKALGSGDGHLRNVVSGDGGHNNCPPGSTDAACSTDSTVGGFIITKTSDPASGSTVTPGSTVTYRVTATNLTAGTITGATFTDDLRDVLDDATLTSGPTIVAPAVGTVTPVTSGDTSFTWTGDLKRKQSVTVEYTVTVKTDFPADATYSLGNVVTSTTPNSTCDPADPNPECGTVNPVDGLILHKEASTSTPKPGDVVRYTVTAFNAGSAARTTTITDDLSGVLDDATYNNDATVSPTAYGTIDLVGSDLKATVTIPSGKTATLSYSVTVFATGTGSGDGVLKNAVVAPDSSNCPEGAATPDPGCGTESDPIPGLKITKTVSPGTSTLTPGSEYTYTVIVENTGQVDYKPATFDDDLSDVLDDAAVVSGSVTATSGDAVFSAAAKKITWTGDLAIGVQATITYTVKVNSPATGNHTMVNGVVSTDDGSSCVKPTDDGCSTITPTPGLTVSKQLVLPTGTVYAGDTVTYRFSIVNSGKTDLTGVSVVDDLSDVVDDATFQDGSIVVNPSIGSASYDPTTKKLTWTGDLVVGARVDVTYQVKVDSPIGGNHELENTVATDTPGSTCPPGSTDPRCSTDTDVSGLIINKTTSASGSVKPGSTVDYTITVLNDSTTKFIGASIKDDLTDIIDDATVVAPSVKVVSGPGTAKLAADGKSILWTGDLKPMEQATISYRVTVNSPATGNLVLRNVVIAPGDGSHVPDDSSNCPAGSTDPRCGTENDISGVIYTKTSSVPADGSVKPGATVTYTVTALNNSEVAATGASFTDDLSDILDDATYNGDASATLGSVDYAEPVLMWTGDIPARTEATITYSITVSDPVRAGANHTLRNAIVGDDSSNCPAGSTDPQCSTDDPVSAIMVEKTSDATSPVAPGTSVTYTVTATNVSAVQAKGVSFSDDLTSVLTKATFDSATITVTGPGAASYDAATKTITWTGNLDRDQTVTVTYTIVVDNPIPATVDHHLTNAVLVDPSNPSNCDPASGDPRCSTDDEVSGLTIAKELVGVTDGDTVAPGQTLTYRVTVLNDSDSARTDAAISDNLADVLDDATYVDGSVSVTPNIGTAQVDTDAATLTWSAPSLAARQQVVIEYQVTVDDPIAGNHRLINAVTSPSENSNCVTGQEPGCSTDTSAGGFTVVKSTDKDGQVVHPGDTVTYTIRGVNDSTKRQTALKIVDDLSDVLDDATMTTVPSASTGSVHFDKSTGVLTWTGDLEPGKDVTITYTVAVKDTETSAGNHTLGNTIVSNGENPNCPEGSTDPRCTTDNPVAGLTINKTTSVPAGSVVNPGDSVTYTVRIENTGNTDQSALTVTDDLSDVLASATLDEDGLETVVLDHGALAFNPGTHKLAWTGDLAPGEFVEFSYTVTVHAAGIAQGAHLRNVITASGDDSNCPPGSTSPKCSTDDPISGFAVSKTSDAQGGVTEPGKQVTYTITGKNTGGADATGLTITDDLSDVLDDASMVPGSIQVSPDGTGVATFDPATSVLTWRGDLAQSEEVTITYTVTVLDPTTTTGNRVLRNVAVSDDGGSTCPDGSTDPDCGTTTDISSLTLAKTSDPRTGAAVVAGTRVSYALTATNTGSATLVDATFTDDLSKVLDDSEPFDASSIALIGTDGLTEAGTVSYDPTTQVLTWVGTLPPGTGVQVSYAVTVAKNVTIGGDNSLVNELTSITPGNNCEEGSTDPRCLTVNPVAGITFKITSAIPVEQSMHLGETVLYTLTATNTGDTDLRKVDFVNSLASVYPDATVISDITQSASWLTDGVTSANGFGLGTVTSTLSADPSVWAKNSIGWVGDIPQGGVVTLTYIARVNVPDTGPHTLTNHIQSSYLNSNCNVGSADPNCSTLNYVEEMSITKTVNRTGAVGPGEIVTYTVTACNEGAVDLVDVSWRDDLSKVLDDATWQDDAKTTAGTVSYQAPVLTWTGTIPVGQKATTTYSVKVKPAHSGDGVLTNAVVSNSGFDNCPVGSTDPRCFTSTKVDPSKLPFTGAQVTGLVAAAAAAFGLGLIIVFLGRRRRQGNGHETP